MPGGEARKAAQRFQGETYDATDAYRKAYVDNLVANGRSASVGTGVSKLRDCAISKIRFDTANGPLYEDFGVARSPAERDACLASSQGNGVIGKVAIGVVITAAAIAVIIVLARKK